MINDPKDSTGYFVVIMSDLDFYQGFHLLPDYDVEAERLIATTRTHVANRYEPTSAVQRAGLGVADEDQPILGALCAALVEVTALRNLHGIGVIGAAIAKLSGKRFFWVSGRRERAGTATQVDVLPPVLSEVLPGLPLPVPVTDAETARKSINMLPEIEAINMRLAAKHRH